MSHMPLMVNTNLNNDLAKVKGGTNAIYGVDGSPVVHDMYFEVHTVSPKNGIQF